MRGRCLCGAVHIEVSGHKPAVSLCHCKMCRLWTGSVFACLEVPSGSVRADGPSKLWNSAIAERAWCETCGSHLWVRDTDTADAPFDLVPGLFDDARNFPLDREVYADRAPVWATLAGDHPRVTAAAYEQTHSFISDGDMP